MQALFKCKKGKKKYIQNNINELKEIRQKTQPITLKTSGSTFKNPSKSSSLEINQAKWMFKAKKGGAEVSSLHSNFLVNQGIASAEDVEELGKMIINKVKKSLD